MPEEMEKFISRSMYRAVKAAGEKFPEHVAYRFMGRDTDYKRFLAKIDRLAACYRGLGVKKDECVLFIMPNMPNVVDSVYALNKIGAVVSVLHPMSAPSEIAFYLEDTGANVIVCYKDMMPAAIEGRRLSQKEVTLISVAPEETVVPYEAAKGEAVKKSDLTWSEFMCFYTGEPVEEETDCNKPSVIFYSGGTTGRPKGILLSSRNLNAIAWQTEAGSGLIPMSDYSMLALIPLFHGFGFGVNVHLMLSLGGKTILVPRFSAMELGDIVLKERPSIIAGVPTLFYGIMMSAGMEGQDLSFLKGAFAGGDSVPNNLKDAFAAFMRKHNSDICLREGYGLTESVTVNCISDFDGGRKGSMGKPLMGNRFCVCRPNSDEVLPVGEQGELCMTGPTVMIGYLNHPEMTESVLHKVDGEIRLHTGDFGYLDEDGYVYYVSRIKRMIISNGYNIYPTEVETVVQTHPNVKQACCVGIDDKVKGQTVCLAVILKDNADKKRTEEELRELCKSKLGEYKNPEKIVFFDSFPNTRVGKIAYAEITKMIAQSDQTKKSLTAEEALRAAMKKVLGKDRISGIEEFYALGGDSHKIFVFLVALKEEGYMMTLSDFAKAKTEEDVLNCIKPVEDDGRLVEEEQEQDKIPESFKSYLSKNSILYDAVYPATPMQEGILYHSLTTNKEVYNVVVMLRMLKKADKSCLEQAAKLTFERFESFRTEFFMREERTYAVVRRDTECPIFYREVTDAKAFAEEISKTGFDMTKGCLFRMFFVTSPEGEWVIYNVHHTVADGISDVNALAYFIDSYIRLCKGDSFDELMKEAVRYRREGFNYNKYLSRPRDKKGAEEFFKEEFAGFEGGDSIASLYSEKSEGRGRANFTLSEQADKKVREFCKKNGFTLNIFCQAVWAIVLQKYTFDEDIVFGTVLDGRDEDFPGLDKAVGLFLNTVPTRLSVRADQTARELLSRVRRKSLAYKQYGFLSMAEILSVLPSLSFGSIFNFKDDDGTTYGVGADTFVNHLLLDSSNYPLEFGITGKGVLSFSLVYDKAIYHVSDMELLGERIKIAFEQIVDHPDIRIADLSVLSEKEKEFLRRINDTDFAFDEDLTVVDRFVSQAERTPDRVAVDFYARKLTYKELNERSDEVAAFLQEKGIEKGDTVAVCIKRSPEMIVALFGILKAGAAYLPVDESYPAERLAFVLKDSGAKAILADDSLVCKADVPVYTEWQTEATFVPQKLKGGDRAYIIYTSGTTGQPKGVVSLHKGLSNLLYAYEKIYDLTERDVVLQVANYTFDQSVWDIFGILCIGGRLALITRDDVRDPDRISIYCVGKQVTIASFTPAMIAELNPEDFPTLRILDSSGEAASLSVLKKWSSKTVVNTYGPTEYTVNACSHIMDDSDTGSLPIGRPILNTKFFVLGKGDGICGTGMNGELCIAGAGLSEGYLNREALSEEKFPALPFGKGRMYRTGDLVRWNKNGEIEFLDRIDEQVKVRGFRIELGEIDSVLRDEQGIKDCFVTLLKKDNDKAIIAYYVGEADVEEVKSKLRERLPDYMIPQYFKHLKRIPRNLSGKVDKAILSKMEPDNEPPVFLYGKQKIVAKVWQELLCVDKVLPTDDFFLMGGDSIKAIRLSAKLLAVGLKISVRKIAEARTLAKISEAAEHSEDEEIESDFSFALQSAVEVYGVDNVEKAYPLTPLQEGMYYHSLLYGDSPEYNTQIVVELPRLNEEVLRKCLRLLAVRYDVLRTMFLHTEKGCIQVVLKNLPPEFNVENGDVKTIAEKDLARGFDLEADTLFRVTYVRQNNKNYLIQNSHHLIMDGWSCGVLLEKIRDIYIRLLKGTPYEKLEEDMLIEAASTPAFSDFVREMLGKKNDQSERYYRRLLKGFDGGRFYPSSKKIEEMVSAEYKAEFGVDLSEVARKIGVTVPVLCQTAWGIVLGMATGRRDALFGNVFSGRSLPVRGIEEMVGMFINTVPIRVNFSSDITLEKLIGEVDKQEQAATEYGFLSLAELDSKIGSVTVFENFSMRATSATVVKITDRTEYDVELEFGDHMPDCIIRYNANKFSESAVRRMARHMKEVFLMMQNDLSCPVKDIVNLTKAEKNSIQKTLIERQNDVAQKHVAVSTERERIVARCMGEILSVIVENAEEDFLNAGGDSIKAIRLSSRLLSEGYTATIRQIMTMRTVKKIAEAMTENSKTDTYEQKKQGVGVSDEDFAYAKYRFGKEAIERVYHATPLQEGMLFHALADGSAYEYNTQIVAELPEGIGPEVLRKALQMVFDHNEVLRSNFLWTEHGALQVVLKRKAAEISVCEGDVNAIADSDLARGFDLGKDALFRITLVRGEKTYYIQNAHHIILDGWSDILLQKELQSVAEALIEGRKPTFEERPSFGKFADYLQRADRESAKKYFAEELKDFDGATEYPSQKEKCPLVRTEEAKARLSALSDVAKKYSCTEAGIINGLFGVVLAKSNFCDAAVFGSVLSGRTFPIEGIDKMIGMLINTVPLLTHVKGTFRDVIAELIQQKKDHFDHGFLPLWDIDVKIGTVIVVNNFGDDEDVPVLRLSDSTGYDLELESTGEELIFRYNPDRYSVEEINALVDAFSTAYRFISEDPDGDVSSWELFDSSKEKQKRRKPDKEIKTEKKENRPPSTTKERIVAKCIKDVMNVDAYADSDVFEIGGDSIKAIRLSARLRREGYTASVKQIMTLRTVEAIAQAMTGWVDVLPLEQKKQGYGVTDEEYAYAQERYGKNVVEQVFRATPLQEGMLFHALADGTAYEYNTQIVAELPEGLEVPVLRRALRIVIERNEVLRSNFLWTEQGGLQVVLKKKEVSFSSLTGDVDAIAEEDLKRGFDLQKDPLLRVTIVRGEKSYYIQNVHHIILDGWSDILLERELFEVVEMLKRGETPDLPKRPSFGKYADWVRQQDKNAAEKYFAEEFRDFDGVTEYPSSNGKRPLRRTEELTVVLPELSEAAKNLSCTESALLCSSFGIALAKSGFKEDAAFGVVVSGRNAPIDGIENMIGMLINTVPLRVRAKGSFRSVAKDVMRQTSVHAEYGYLPLSDIGVKIGAVFVVNSFGDTADTETLRISDSTGYDLELETDGKEVVIRYNPNRYSAEEMQDFADAVKEGCLALKDRPDDDVGEWKIFDENKEKEYRNKQIVSHKAVITEEREPQTPEEKMIARCIKEVLNVDVNATSDFFEIGGDSIKAIRLSARIRREGHYLTVKDIMDGRTVEKMARHARKNSTKGSERFGIVPLTPVMKDFFKKGYPVPDRYVQDLLVEVDPNTVLTKENLEKVYERHDMLRARFDGKQLFVPSPEESKPLSYIEVSGDPVEISERVKREMKLSGPLFRTAHIRHDGKEYLYLCAHHLIIDGVSWRVLMEDIYFATVGAPFPPRTMSFVAYAKMIADGIDISLREENYWKETQKEIVSLPIHPDADRVLVKTITLNEKLTSSLLYDAGRTYNVRPDIVMLSALARAGKRICGVGRIAVLLEGHGRYVLPDEDLTSTIGWFTSYFPVVLSGEGKEESCLIHNKEIVAAVPRDGVAYPFLQESVLPEILFNYMGNYDGDLQRSRICRLPDDYENPEPQKLDIESEISEGKLAVSFRTNGVREEDVDRWINCFTEELTKLIRWCASRETRIKTPADFGYGGMPLEDFAEVILYRPVRIGPLTPTQEGMVYHSEQDPEAYLDQSILRFPFVLDFDRCKEVFKVLCNRHELFRTHYVRCASGRLYQYTQEKSSVVLHKAEDVEKTAAKRLKEGVSPFDGVPLKIDIVEDKLIITFHHILWDAWSEDIFVDEILKLYRGEEVPDAPIDVSFIDHAKNYPYLLSRVDFDKWVDLVKGAEATFVPGHGKEKEYRRLERELPLADLITEYVSRTGRTENVLFESAVALFVRKVTGKKDVLFGKVVSGRDATTENAVGLYISTLPVRVKTDDIVGEIAAQEELPSAGVSLAEIFDRAGLHDPMGVLFVYNNIGSYDEVEQLSIRDSTNYGVTIAVNKLDGFIVDIETSGEYLPEEGEAFFTLFTDCIAEVIGKKPERKPLMGESVRYPETLIELWKDNRPFAVEMDGRSSGEEIRRKAESLAYYLHEKYPKGVVGVRCERGVNMLIAIYGIVLSGNAYLPIGVDYPEERVRYMCEQAGASTVLTDEFMKAFPYDDNSYVADVRAEDPCYVIFTSGSTGKPKGAIVSHGAVSNRLCWMERKYPLMGGTVLQKTPYTFDVSVWEIFRPVLFGGTLALMEPGRHADPKAIAEAIEKYKATQAHFVPSVYDVYLEYCKLTGAKAPKDVFLSGEKLPVSMVKRHFALFKNVGLHNLYGPTECAVDVTFYDCTGEEKEVPIGAPIDNTEISVRLGDEILPPYIEGEIVVGGRAVGNGYVGKDRGGFVGGTYRTGDIGYTDKNGLVCFVGRKDGQIKLHGQRVELGEIEACIRAIEGVKDAAVVFDKKEDAVTAYVVSGKEEKEIRTELKKSLPGYMIPSTFVFIEKIPLSENGKRDLSALPRVNAAGQKDVLPQTTARLILDAVCKVARREIGFTSSFEEAGLSSLDRMRMATVLSPMGYTFADLVRSDSVKELYEKSRREYFMRYSSGNEYALLCIPYAGGTGRIFRDLRIDGYDVYASVLATYDKEWDKVVAEVKEIKKNYKKVFIYSHCLGCMTALALISEVGCDGWIAGAHIPDAVSSFFGRPIDAFKNATDGGIMAELTSAGLKTEETDFISLFRSDAKNAAKIEARKPCVEVKTTLLLAEKDVLSPRPSIAERRWKKFLSSTPDKVVLKGEGHYFVESGNLGKELRNILEKYGR